MSTSTTTTVRVKFSDEEKELIRRAASAVWDECAYDVLQGVADEKGKNINAVTVSRAVAIEIALDAGRCEDRIRRSKNPLATADLLTRMSQATYRQLIAIVRPSFPFARYGM